MSQESAAAYADLCSLHSDLARVLKDAIQKKDENGQTPAAVLSVARQFLKDNKIEAQAKKGSPMGDLAALPVFDQDDDFDGAPLQ